MDELSEEDKLTVARARKIQRFLSQPSKSLRYLLVTLASSSPWNRPSLVSPKFSLANTITCPRSHSTWLETFQR